jgi:hypothetical protein
VPSSTLMKLIGGVENLHLCPQPHSQQISYHQHRRHIHLRWHRGLEAELLALVEQLSTEHPSWPTLAGLGSLGGIPWSTGFQDSPLVPLLLQMYLQGAIVDGSSEDCQSSSFGVGGVVLRWP